LSSEEARAEAIARDYLALTPEERRKTLLLAGTNQERLAITQAIRTGLKAEGQLGQSILMQRLKARDLTTVQMAYAHHFQVGDVLIPQASYKRWGLERGQRYEVIEVDVPQNVLTLRAETGPALQVDPARVGKKSVYRVEKIEVAVGDRLKWTKNQATLGRRNGQEFEVCEIEDGQVLIRYGSGKTESLSGSELAHLDYALVSTTYGAQGKSAERVIGALDRHLGRESFYVTVSRVKHDLKLYASEHLDILVERAIKSITKENPSDAGLSPFRPEDVCLQHLNSDKAIDVLHEPTSCMSARSDSKVAKVSQNAVER
jgi:ATP-dependent exoDNAse (exonuclease V) alpha subunit